MKNQELNELKQNISVNIVKMKTNGGLSPSAGCRDRPTAVGTEGLNSGVQIHP